MLEKFLIFGGLTAFLLAATFPFWQNAAPEDYPKVAMETKGEQCVAPASYMRENHMQLLNEWRDSVVRDGDRFHIMPDGSKVEKSLTKTCLGCHVSQEKFCEECHTYASVKPYCWECHVTPKSGAHTELTGIETEKLEEDNLLNNLLVRNRVFVAGNLNFAVKQQ
ncbi:MAG: sulfate reduction electron transfer complex DsrMKJOP subunit DsrJ [SAR324 cluster bacterium]|nr:sulfate reduction electron transfer complex DsrMKJOP subunit DsrJ [SAR324 cluster bacterium]